MSDQERPTDTTVSSSSLMVGGMAVVATIALIVSIIAVVLTQNGSGAESSGAWIESSAAGSDQPNRRCDCRSHPGSAARAHRLPATSRSHRCRRRRRPLLALERLRTPSTASGRPRPDERI